jgi:hypothetical protein
MGLGIFSKHSDDRQGPVPRGNPDPCSFIYVRHEVRDNFLLLEVIYPNCTNFEGRKILLLRSNSRTLLDWPERVWERPLDPHFQDDKFPIMLLARFQPTTLGWELGRIMMQELLRQSLGRDDRPEDIRK